MFKSGIYKITNLLNNKCYIGSAIDIKHRWKVHQRFLKNSKHHSILLQRAYDKYGKENFKYEIIDYVSSPKNLIKYEQLWLNEVKPEYNVCKNAGSCLGVKRSEEVKNKLSESKKNSPYTTNQIEHMASLKRGTHLSDEQKKQISERHKGKKMRPRTNEEIENCRKAAIKRFEGQKLENHPNAKLTWDIVRNIRKEKLKGFSLSLLAEKYNVKRAAIWKVVKNYSWIEKGR